MCKIYLNNHLIFDSLTTSVDTDSKREFDNSTTKFIKKECDCEKEKNGFWPLKCCIDNCENCKEKKNYATIKQLESEKEISYYQFQITESIYTYKKQEK